MLNDSLFHRLARRFKQSFNMREEPNEFLRSSKGGRRGSGQHTPGSFNNANNFTIDRPTFVDQQVINNVAAGTMTMGPDPMLERVMACANLRASVDSSARFPPPTCHPGTRVKIGDTLLTWSVNPNREWNLLWLTGSAGTGKSAVCQTFAERCAEKGRLGASFFFSRPNDRNDPNTVIPTLVYQLAVCHPPYKALVMAQLANDPAILGKTRWVQFQKLIVEPFSQLQTQEQQRIQEPLLVVLDGLDECQGENDQKEIIEMIGEVVQQKTDFPLVWLICSRPEPHLKYLFSRADFTVYCGREELVIDAESIADVDFYLRDGLAGIKADFSDVTTPIWPPEKQIAELSMKASGHFGFAWTSLRYIGDPIYSAPMRRLNTLLSFLKGVSAGSSNPLEALDALYTAILNDVPKDDLPITMQVLGFFLFGALGHLQTVQGHCNFLHIDQETFYNAFRKLHSVIDIPSPESASRRHFRLYHASFQDYLANPSRAGKFTITMDAVILSRAKLFLSWYKTDLELFHTTDGPLFNISHEHGILPGLSWVLGGNEKKISTRIADETCRSCWYASSLVKEWDEALVSQIRNFDFRYIRDNLHRNWRLFLNKLWEIESLSGIIRTEPQTEFDLQLVEYMKYIVQPLQWRSRPVTFPLGQKFSQGEYCFVGYGSKAIICWVHDSEEPSFSLLNSDRPPSKDWVATYQANFGIGDGRVTNDEQGECGSTTLHCAPTVT